MLGSFKFKLVGTFLALSVLPLAAAFWGFSQVADRSVTTSADDRLGGGGQRPPWPHSRMSAGMSSGRPRPSVEPGVPDGRSAWRPGHDRVPARTLSGPPRRGARRQPDRGRAAAGGRDRRFRSSGRVPTRRHRRLGPTQRRAGPQAARALGPEGARRAGDRPAEWPDQRGVHDDAERHHRRDAGSRRDRDDRRSQLPCGRLRASCPRAASSSPPSRRPPRSRPRSEA